MTQLCFHFHVGPPMKPRHHSILIIVSFSLNEKSLKTNIETNVEANQSKNNQNIFVSRRFPDFNYSYYRVSYRFVSQWSRLIKIACHMQFQNDILLSNVLNSLYWFRAKHTLECLRMLF